MPKSPVRGCAYGRCNKRAVPGSQYCEEHKKIMDRQYNRYTREEDVKKKYGTAWKKARDRHAARYPYCEQCYREGKITMMDEVHHIVPVSRGGTNEDSNLMSLCRSCHNKIHHDLGDR